jgi:putative membrane-bound dehydrogenase-like protein
MDPRINCCGALIMRLFRICALGRRAKNRHGIMRGALAIVGALIVAAHAAPAAGAPSWQPQPVPTTKPAPATAAPVYYRCFIRVPDNMTSRAPVDLYADSALLSFADIRGPFTVFLNGQKIAAGEMLPAEPRRRFKIPKGILEKKVFNVLALRLEGTAAKNGLPAAPGVHGYFDELLLAGDWEMLSGEPEPADLRPSTNQPARAFFTEKNFHEASTVLSRNVELISGTRVPPAESLAQMRTPADLVVELLLREPEISQPTHFSFDSRGRLWVAQYRQYPYPAGLKMVSRDKYYRSTFDRVPPAPPKNDPGHDIISVHEDADGDGKFDRHRNVLTGLNMANAVLHGHGGIWVMNTPYLLFYPDSDGDDVPDRAPEVRLAGFGLEDTHSLANGLVWGPDGWIYGAQGSTTISRVRRPGVDAPDAPGVYHEACMIWRYHPDTHAYEIFAEGGGNTFGLEVDAEGRIYSGHNGGETRGWHFVQGGVYLKQGKDPGKYGPPANPFTFQEMPMIKSATTITRFSHHFAIAEGSAIPPKYLGKLFSVDPLHRNVVLSERTWENSTFSTADIGFALETEDKTFRPVFVANAPDGSIYVADFCEEYIAHGQHYQGQLDPESGRIYRLRGKEATLNRDIDLSRKSTGELLALLADPGKWQRQTAVRLLGERRDPAAKAPLEKLIKSDRKHPALEALWTFQQAGWFTDELALNALLHPVPEVRAWSIRLLGDNKKLPPAFAEAVTRLVATEANAEVRCQIISSANRLDTAQALPLLAAVLKRDADSDDPFIPLLAWYAIESRCDHDRDAVLQMFAPEKANADTPGLTASSMVKEQILPKLIRRFASKGSRADLLACAQLLRAAPTDAHRKLLLDGFEAAFKGRALPPLPNELMSALAAAGRQSPILQLRSGDPAAVDASLTLISDAKASREQRLTHVRALGEMEQPRAIPALLALVKRDDDLEIRKAALAALARADDVHIGREVAAMYPQLPGDLQLAAQSVLASRASWSADLLALVDNGTVPPRALSPETTARLRQQTDEKIAALIGKLLPAKTATPAPRANVRAAMENLQRTLAKGPGDPYKGETIFLARCAACHQLFHKGGRIGPNLTAYQRDDLTTMLPSILDPSAEIREGFTNYFVQTKDGRSLSGFIADQDANIVVLRGLDGQDVPLTRADLREITPSPSSLMPPGLLEGLDEQQLRDFFAYLRIPQPITK